MSIPFFVLNLKKYPKKYKRTEKNLNNAGITTNIIRYDAFDGLKKLPNIKAIKKSKSKKELNHNLDTMRKILTKKKILHKNINYYLTPGEIGHYLSFYNMFKLAHSSKYKMIFIVEDDIYFVDSQNFANNLKNILKNVPKDWDIIYFGMNKGYFDRGGKLKKINKIKNICIPTGTSFKIKKYNKTIYGNYAMIYSKKAIKYFIKNMMPMRMPTDIYMGRLCVKKKIKCYSSCINLIQPITSEGSTTKLNITV
jgi:GR25 family glycosyltransferase involved in LPS biosynthesis